jgi:hypothetical protein
VGVLLSRLGASTTSPDCALNPVVDMFSGPVFVGMRLQSEGAAWSLMVVLFTETGLRATDAWAKADPS